MQKREGLYIIYVYYRIAGFRDGGRLEDVCQIIVKAHIQYVRIKEFVIYRLRMRCIVAGLAATDVEGVECMSGNITNELVSKLGMKVLSKGVTVEITDKTAVVYISVILKYGYSIPEVSEKIQERVASAIETMTGLTVAEVNIKIAGVKVENNK